MVRPRLAISIPAYNRARMLDAVLREYQPTCEALSIPILVHDNGSKDETPAVCAAWAERWSGFRFRRREESIPLGRSVMSALESSDAEYTWLAGDDDALRPEGIRLVADLLSARDPDAVVVGTTELPRPDFVDLEHPLGAQLAPLLPERVARTTREFDDAGLFFAARHIILPAPSVVYRTDRILATDYQRYQVTHHAHIGSLFDALAAEQERCGRVDVVELTDICSVSLTVHHGEGKDQWNDLFRYFALEAFPKWFALLPPLYAPHIPIAEAHHRHIFRAVLNPDDESARKG